MADPAICYTHAWGGKTRLTNKLEYPKFLISFLLQVMFSVTGLEFSFTQAPESMKSVLQGCWQLTVAFGNLIVVFLVGINIFPQQSSEFLLFAGLMFVDMGIFAILAYYYKPISLEELDKIDDDREDVKKEPIEETTKF
jgi:solute carrier family 15 oligopeptide transporter 1